MGRPKLEPVAGPLVEVFNPKSGMWHLEAYKEEVLENIVDLEKQLPPEQFTQLLNRTMTDHIDEYQNGCLIGRESTPEEKLANARHTVRVLRKYNLPRSVEQLKALFTCHGIKDEVIVEMLIAEYKEPQGG